MLQTCSSQRCGDTPDTTPAPASTGSTTEDRDNKDYGEHRLLEQVMKGLWLGASYSRISAIGLTSHTKILWFKSWVNGRPFLPLQGIAAYLMDIQDL